MGVSVRVARSRELVAQGVGNVVSGLAGGLPITQVIAAMTIVAVQRVWAARSPFVAKRSRSSFVAKRW